MDKESIKELIAKGRIDNALNSLIDEIKKVVDDQIRNDFILQSSRLKRILREKNLGLESPDSISITINQITAAVLIMVDELDDELVKAKLKNPPKHNSQKEGHFAGLDVNEQVSNFENGGSEFVFEDYVIDDLIDHLNDPNEEIRGVIVEILSVVERSDINEILLHTFEDWLQKETLNIGKIVELETLQGIELLIAALKISYGQINRMAFKLLGVVSRKKAIEQSIKAIYDQDQFIRICAINTLARAKSIDAIDPLIDTLNDGSHWVKLQAIRALGYIGDNRAILPLINLIEGITAESLNENGKLILYGVIRSLGKIQDKRAFEALIKVLEFPDYGIKQEVIMALGALKNRNALKYFINILEESKSESTDLSHLQAVIMEAFGNLGDRRATKYLIQGLKFNEEFVRTEAVIALGKLKDKRAIPHLLSSLNDYDLFSRIEVCKSLIILEDNRGIELLLSYLESPDLQTKIESAFALGKLGNDLGVNTLINELSTIKEDKRLKVALSLAGLGDHRAIQPLLEFLNDPNENIRLSAIIGLGSMINPYLRWENVIDYEVFK